MTLAFRCRCGKALRVRDEFAGKRVKCPQCGQVCALPAAVAAKAAGPAPAAPPRPHKVLLPDGRVEKVRDTPETPPAPYRIDLGAWCRTANAHYAAVLGPMAGYLCLFLLIVVGLALLSLVLIGYLGFFLLLPHLAAGPTVVCLLQLRGRKWSFADFFAGFRRYGTWLALELLATLILVGGFLPGLLIGVLAGAVSYALRLDPNSPVMMVPGILSFLVTLAGFLAGTYVWFRAGIFARQLVIDRGCGAIDALKGSWCLTRGHFWGLFGTFLLILLGAEVASLVTCGIGLFFALPYALLVLNAGYLHIAGTRSEGSTGAADSPDPVGAAGPVLLPATKGVIPSANDSIRTTCPKCHHVLRAKAAAAGKRARCPNAACGAVLRIPPASHPAPAPPRPPTRPWVYAAGGAVAVALLTGLALATGLRGWSARGGANKGPDVLELRPGEVHEKTLPGGDAGDKQSAPQTKDVPKAAVPLPLDPADGGETRKAGLPALPADNGKGDLAKLKGSWKVVSADEGGSPRSEWAGGTFTFRDDKVVLSNAVGTSFTKVELGISEVRTASSPRVIVFDNAKEWIYLLDGDSLKVAADLVENKPPAKFPGRSTPGIAVYTLRRMKTDDGGGAAPEVPTAERMAKGGANWSSTAKATLLGEEKAAGTRLWVWPTKDEVVVIKRSDPRMRLACAVRPGQSALAEGELRRLGYDVQLHAIGRTAFFFGPVKGLRAGDSRGEVEFRLGDSIREYQGEGELLVHLHLKGEPASNFLTLKARLVD
jgi:uncharacterized protein (TIGR03067 family)